MTDPIVSIEPIEMSVEPGGQARVEVTVRNPSSIVEEYRLEVLAEVPGEGPAAWAEVHPPALRVYPKEKASAIVVLSPPLGTGAASGRFPFAVRAVSTVPPADAAGVAEGDLEIGMVFGLRATITPMTSSGRWRGHHVLRYTNWGNAPARLRLDARDPDERLGFLLRPTDLDLPLGGNASVRLTVRTRKPFLRGTPARLPFEVTADQDGPGEPPPSATPDDRPRSALAGALLQKPIVSRGTVAVAGLAAAGLAGALVLALNTPKGAPQIASSSLPDPPTHVVAVANSTSEIAVTWVPAAPGNSHRLITRVGNTVIDTTDIKPLIGRRVVGKLQPATQYCFELMSVRATLTSEATQPVCKTTRAAPSSSSPGTSSSSSSSSSSSGPISSSGGSSSTTPTSTGPPPLAFTRGQVLALVDIYPDDQPHAEAKAMARFQQLLTRPTSTLTPDGIFETKLYPDLLLSGKKPSGAWLIYIGPYADGSAADAACAQQGITHCVKVYPAGL